MQPEESKVFVNSLPKSGTNLVSKCLDLMGYIQVGGIDASLVLRRSMKARVRRFFYKTDSIAGYQVGIDLPVRVSQKLVTNILARAVDRQYVTGHVGYGSDLLELIKSDGYRPLLILRDPRSVLNSFVHYVDSNEKHTLHLLFKDKSLGQKYQYALHGVQHGTVVLRPLLQRCLAMDAWLTDDQVHQLRFESLVGASGGGSREDQERALQKMAKFIGANHVVITDIADKVFGPGRSTFRKGSISGWKEEMPPAVQEEATAVLGTILAEWGYE